MTTPTSAFVPKQSVNDWMSFPTTYQQRYSWEQDRNKQLLSDNSALTEKNSALQNQLDDKSFWDKDTLGAAAGIGSVALQMVALPDQLKMARTQRKALEQNMATAKEEQARRNRINNNIGNVRPSQPTSAFAQ